MAPHTNTNVQLLRRDDASSTTDEKSLPIIALVGFGLAGLVLLILVIWLSIVFWRKRQKKKRADERGAAFLTVKGLVTEGQTRESFWSASATAGVPGAGVAFPADLQAVQRRHQQQQQQQGEGNASAFSRANLTSSIILPDKCIVRPDATREEIIAHHQAEGNLPRPFAPFSFAMAAAGGSGSHVPPSPKDSFATGQSKTGATFGSIDSLEHDYPSPIPRPRARHSPQRSSIFSALRDSVRDSFLSASASPSGGIRASFASTNSSGSNTTQVRRVRQTFTPILPDEPLLKLGERVTIMQSFDDGWCVIAREAPFGDKSAAAAAESEVELGTVPAWCFVKPMKGLRSERPIRGSSLGVTVKTEGWNDAPGKREDIISWSNF